MYDKRFPDFVGSDVKRLDHSGEHPEGLDSGASSHDFFKLSILTEVIFKYMTKQTIPIGFPDN